MSECDDQRVPVACSLCFSDRGLYLDAERNGMAVKTPCPNCGSPSGKQLDADALETIAHKFFVWRSLQRFEFGMAPRVMFNQHQKTSIEVPPWLLRDVALFERLLGIGFFEYGPGLWRGEQR
jgi:hypothetical protein